MFKDVSRDDNLNLMLDNAFKMRIKDIRTTILGVGVCYKLIS